MKVVRLSALHNRLPLPPGNILGIHFCYRPSRPQGHSAAGRIMSMKKSSDTIGNRTRDLPVCSAVPQPLRHRVYAILTAQKMPLNINTLCFSHNLLLSEHFVCSSLNFTAHNITYNNPTLLRLWIGRGGKLYLNKYSKFCIKITNTLPLYENQKFTFFFMHSMTPSDSQIVNSIPDAYQLIQVLTN
jgi:hypothetical protein